MQKLSILDVGGSPGYASAINNILLNNETMILCKKVIIIIKYNDRYLAMELFKINANYYFKNNNNSNNKT